MRKGGCPPNGEPKNAEPKSAEPKNVDSEGVRGNDHCCVGAGTVPPSKLGRYLLENFTIVVGAANSGYVVDIGGTGVVVRGITVKMAHR
jgi:hypothetical protein